MKPFKNWGIVKFIKKNIPKAAGDIAEAGLGIVSGENPVKAIAGVISKHSGDLTEKQLKQARELMIKDLKREKLALSDLKNARALQKSALQQEDTFSKRFIYYYATGVTLLAFAIVLLLIFVNVPGNNQRILDMSFGVIIGTGLVGVFQFFFGSSQGSKDKDAHIKSLMDLDK